MKYILIIVLTVLVSGCYSTGKDIDLGQTSSFEKGVTTEAEVVQRMGKPMTTTVDSRGFKILTYIFSDTDVDAATYIPIVGLFAGGAQTEMKTLTVTLDESNIVTDWSYTETTTEVN